MERKPIHDAARELKRRWTNNPDAGLSIADVATMEQAIDEAEGAIIVTAPRPEREAADPFDAALTEILRHEGGYADHPRDPGGRTMLGVTQRVWEDWTGQRASEADMRALTREKVAPLYRKNYWEAVQGDDLPPGLALCVFDFAVNAGPARSARYLQRLVGSAQDGKIGPLTLAAVEAAVQQQGEAELVRRFQQSRRDYYRQLGTFKTFGKGWLRRVDDVEAAALELVS